MTDRFSFIEKPVDRRRFLQGVGITGLALTLCPGLVLAQARTNQRLVIIIQRGAMDGLAAVAPYGDPNYAALRGDIALSSDTLLRLDNRFGLHPSLKPLYDMFQSGQLAVIPATASPYRQRSHFEGQSVLELGSTGQPYALSSGWLNRVAQAINARDSTIGLAFGDNVPMMLRGDMKLGSFAPSSMPHLGTDFMTLLGSSYMHDPLFKSALDQGMNLQQQATDPEMRANPQAVAAQKKSTGEFPAMCALAGKWLARPDGPRLATIELGGWDTHVAQGTEGGRLANNFDVLARGLAQLQETLGPAWATTTVITLTEFGRTARPNGNRGTDHGTGSAMFLAGGAVKGGIYGDWPGIGDAQLYQNRDLMPTNDIRSPLKGVLNSLYGLSPATLDNDIYPGSGNATQMSGLIRSI